MKSVFSKQASISQQVVEIKFWKNKKKWNKKMKCDKKLKKSYFLNEHNIHGMWCEYDVIPINLVFRVANQKWKTISAL